MMYKYVNGTGWTVNMFGSNGEKCTIKPNETIILNTRLTKTGGVSVSVVEEQKKMKVSRKKSKYIEPDDEEEKEMEDDEI